TRVAAVTIVATGIAAVTAGTRLFTDGRLLVDGVLTRVAAVVVVRLLGCGTIRGFARRSGARVGQGCAAANVLRGLQIGNVRALLRDIREIAAGVVGTVRVAVLNHEVVGVLNNLDVIVHDGHGLREDVAVQNDAFDAHRQHNARSVIRRAATLEHGVVGNRYPLRAFNQNRLVVGEVE